MDVSMFLVVLLVLDAVAGVVLFYLLLRAPVKKTE